MTYEPTVDEEPKGTPPLGSPPKAPPFYEEQKADYSHCQGLVSGSQGDPELRARRSIAERELPKGPRIETASN